MIKKAELLRHLLHFDLVVICEIRKEVGIGTAEITQSVHGAGSVSALGTCL